MNHRLLPLLYSACLLGCGQRIENAREVTVLVNGNCSMCKETIEESVGSLGSARVDWNNRTREAVITFDSVRSSLPDVLRQVAMAGYDNALFEAPDSVYERLPHCCKYERTGTNIHPPRGDEPMNH